MGEECILVPQESGMREGGTSTSVSSLWLMAAKLSFPKGTLKKQRFWLLHL